MKNKRDKLLGKIIKKDYNNELEEVLSKKNFNEDVKNLLLDILYKIENAYGDYTEVKINVLSKEEYIQNIINIIKNSCNSIKFITSNAETDIESKKFKIDFENKEIECFPIERKILYCLGKIKRRDDIVKSEGELLNRTLTNLLNIGNNINLVEPLRDFNGFSWNISVSEIENLYYNIIYQDLIILVGNRFLEDWVNKREIILDYMVLFKEKLEGKYGSKISKKIIKLMKKLSILLELSTNSEFENEIKNRKKEAKKELECMNNRAKFLEDICSEKKKLEKRIKKIDLINNDKNLLQDEYNKINKRLPLDKKIFSMRVFSKKLNEEREKDLSKINEYNSLMNPSNFKIRKIQLEELTEYLELADSEKKEDKIYENIIEMQKQILRAFKVKIDNVKSKDELLKIIYEFRYFCLIPISEEKNMKNCTKLWRLEKIVIKEILRKANEFKLINEIFKEVNENIEVLKNMFSLQIISLEDIFFKVFKENDSFYIQFFDENIIDERFKINLEVNKEDFKIKLGKKIKLFS